MFTEAVDWAVVEWVQSQEEGIDQPKSTDEAQTGRSTKHVMCL